MRRANSELQDAIAEALLAIRYSPFALTYAALRDSLLALPPGGGTDRPAAVYSLSLLRSVLIEMPNRFAACVRLPKQCLSVSRMRSRSTSDTVRPTSARHTGSGARGMWATVASPDATCRASLITPAVASSQWIGARVPSAIVESTAAICSELAGRVMYPLAPSRILSAAACASAAVSEAAIGGWLRSAFMLGSGFSRG